MSFASKIKNIGAWPVVIILIGLIGVWIVSIIRSANDSFPEISLGEYVGTISGLANRPLTFYVERLSTESLFVVLFAENFSPSRIPLRRRAQKHENEGPFEPVVISFGDTEYLLRGVSIEGGFSGEVYLGEKDIGSWKLRKKENVTIRRKRNDALEKWLDTKAQYLALKTNVDKLEERKVSFRESRRKLLEYLSNEELLKTRAEERYSQLKDNLKKARTEQENAEDSVKNLVSELEMMRRITKRGRVVELARRVAKREYKWYLANWSDRDTGVLEQLAKQLPNVDTLQLQKKMEKVRQVQNLKRQIAQEQEMINSILEAERVRQEPEMPPARIEKNDVGKRSLWDRLF